MALSTKKIAGEDSVHYVPPRKKRALPKPKMQPPLTPMIDVTFQLLLFFLLTFTFREAEGLIPGSLPRGDQGSSAQEKILERIEIKVRAPDREHLDDVVFAIRGDHTSIRNPKQLLAELKTKRRSCSDETPVVITASGAVRWEHVVTVFNAAVYAEFKKIGFSQ